MASDQTLSSDLRTGALVTPMSLLQYWGPVAVYAGLIFFGSSLSSPPESLASFLQKVSDKVLHLFEYSVLGGLLYRACRHAAGEWLSRRALLAAAVGAALYGLSDETHQLFVPFREADLLDLVADTVGGTLGGWGWSLVERCDGAKARARSRS
ncbi:MAG: VanZ family protein [Nitrospira sp.]|jgi:VanZ family protein|nr:VanZ family protein [Nitrospira sp.]MCC7470200.1 VanZ family protein [Candidatus Nomurabacteria bacterium]